MKKLLLTLALCLATLTPVQSAGVLFLAQAPSGGACVPGTQATNFLARTSGLSTPETNAYCTLINGLVSDGIITGTMNGANSGSGACGSLLDALYIFATNTATTANLNLCGTSYTITPTSSPTFTADQGYTGNAATSFLNTNFNPSTATTPNFVQNSASLGAYILTNRTTTQTYASIGNGATPYAYVEPYRVSGANNVNLELNGATFPFATASPATSQGFTGVVRTVSTSINGYKNNSSTPFGSALADNSTGVKNASMSILQATNVGSTFSSDQTAAAFIGAGITGAQWLAISTRVNNFMSQLATPINVY